MGRRLATTLTLLIVVCSAPIHAEVSGTAVITDGDSLTVAGERVRLFGIDAPESKQTCVAPAAGAGAADSLHRPCTGLVSAVAIVSGAGMGHSGGTCEFRGGLTMA